MRSLAAHWPVLGPDTHLKRSTASTNKPDGWCLSHKAATPARTHRVDAAGRLWDTPSCECVVLETAEPLLSRRRLLSVGAVAMASCACAPQCTAEDSIQALQEVAYAAYSARDFTAAGAALDSLVKLEPSSARWREMRAQVLVDAKRFPEAIQDFNEALTALEQSKGSSTDTDVLMARARLLSGRALAYEGLADWRKALDDYDEAMVLAAAGGESPDPYVINARGNCHNSLGEWAAARQDYKRSSDIFQAAKGFRGRNGNTTARLDGAVFSASNAALMLAELGDQQGALNEMQRIARRAPGSADMRAALAALYWAQGRQEEAEASWEFSCNSISVGCKKYQDPDWLRRIRRWPPSMVAAMSDFLKMRAPGASAAQAS